MNFAETLRQLIDDADISQKALAQEIRMSPSTLANYVQGSRSPDYATLMAIARYFNVTTDYLLGFQLDRADDLMETKLMQIFRSLTPTQREIYIEQGDAFVRANRKGETRQKP